MVLEDLLLVGAGATASYIYCSNKLATTTKEFLPKKESYRVYTDANQVYAMNGNTGNIDKQGTDASSVIQYAIDNSNHGLIYIKTGDYDIRTTIDLGSTANKNRNSISIIGQRSNGYYGTRLIGNTGNNKAVIETTASDGIYISNIGIASGDVNPSGIGIFQARDTYYGWAGNQIYENVYVGMISKSSMNNGIGSIGIVNFSGEETKYHNIEIWANLPFLLTAYKTFLMTYDNISGQGTYSINSSLGYPLPDSGSTTVFGFSGTGRMIAYDFVRPIFYNYGGASVNLGQTFMQKRSSRPGAPTGQNKVAIESWNSYQFSHTGSVEGVSIYWLTRRDITEASVNIRLAANNETSLPVIYLYDDGGNYVFDRSQIIIFTYDATRPLISGQRYDGNTTLPLKWTFTNTTFSSNDNIISPRVQL